MSSLQILCLVTVTISALIGESTVYQGGGHNWGSLTDISKSIHGYGNPGHGHAIAEQQHYKPIKYSHHGDEYELEHDMQFFHLKQLIMSSPLLYSLTKCKITKEEALKIISEAKDKSKLSFSDLADKLHVNKVWLVAAFNGEHPFEAKVADKLIKLLKITGTPEELNSLAEALVEVPSNRGGQNNGKDPVVRRFIELVDIYGLSLTALIREEAGDGIMSAVDCTINFEVVMKKNDEGKKEQRIVITIDGKFLPYKVDHDAKSRK